jgi:MFS family permease
MVATTEEETPPGEEATLQDPPEVRGEKSSSPPGTPENSPNPEATSTQLADQTQRLPFSRLIITYISLATCFFVSFMDVNAASTALPAIARALNASNTITWVGTAYLLAQCAFQVIYGRLADIFGRKPVLLGCVASLILGDILSGFARNGPWLYVCRAISGIGGGGISSLVQITVSDLVSLKDRGKYQGLLSGAIGLGAATGPFISAALIGTGDNGWRWAFWVPAILAALCVPTLVILVPQKPVTGSWQDKVRRIDWMGLFSAITGILFLLVCFSFLVTAKRRKDLTSG